VLKISGGTSSEGAGPVAMAVGRLARNQGYALLIRAFHLAAQRAPQASLFLAAGSPK
jgi:mannosylfructose-phosphate synthase